MGIPGPSHLGAEMRRTKSFATRVIGMAARAGRPIGIQSFMGHFTITWKGLVVRGAFTSCEIRRRGRGTLLALSVLPRELFDESTRCFARFDRTSQRGLRLGAFARRRGLGRSGSKR